MYNTGFAPLEQMMLLPPNFTPRRSGFKVSGNIIYSAHDVAGDRYSQIRKRLEAGDMTYYELVTKRFFHLKNNRAKSRIYHRASCFKGWLYRNVQHMIRNAWARKNLGFFSCQQTPAFIAAFFLLTSDADLWERAQKAVISEHIDFSRVRLRGIGMDNYILYQTAKSLYTGARTITSADLADTSIVNEETLVMIINATLLAHFGCDAYNLIY
jgi:hypothetical protein